MYAPFSLAVYDVVVHGISNHFIWRCPTYQLRRLYDRNVTARHVDVGVGTGYFLARAHWPVARPEITLVDLNPHCLARAAGRISRLSPGMVEANVFEPLPAAQMGKPYTSAGLCYLLHCLPGSMKQKAQVFDHLVPHLADGAHVFGATILPGDATGRGAPNWAARQLMRIYNAKGVFSNEGDRIEDLEAELARRFEVVDIRLYGTVALFEARYRGADRAASTP
ncbi:MAG: class I SAM-dependent methyltransferase [Hyphomicrobiaceae bacterium]|nr:class I SAM-dependent methyltransferase [Hyphomicrobiaceae bacterium]